MVAALPALVLGLAWQGSRGLWEPDEGRNANIALGMLESGDWLVPRLNGDPYLDKPPLHFWSVAASLRALGAGEWGARIPNALFFALTAALVGALGHRMWGERAGRLSAWVYATTLAPFVAANVVTPDTGLAACVTLLFYAYWRAEHDGHVAGDRGHGAAAGGDGRLGGGTDLVLRGDGSLASLGWWLLAGLAGGLGLLTKGPAMLVFLPPLAAHLALRWRHRAAPLGPGPWLGVIVAALLGLAWYLPMVRSLPGAGAYLLDSHAVGRLVGSKYHRSPGWTGAITVYLPMLLAGVVPWSFWWLARAQRAHTQRAHARLDPARLDPARLDPARRLSRWRLHQMSSAGLLLNLWFALPLTVFVGASSRLPLYLLPLFAPFALVTGCSVSSAWGSASRPRRQWAVALFVAWCAVLLGLKLAAARYPSHRDARLAAAWIAAQGVGSESTLLVVDATLNGLRLYGYPDLRWVRAREDAYPLFTPLPTLDKVASALAAERRRVAAVVSSASWIDEVTRRLETAGFACEARPSDLRIALLLCSPSALVQP